MNELYAQYIDGKAANICRRSQIRFPNSSNRIDLLTDAELADRGWYKLHSDAPEGAIALEYGDKLVGIIIERTVTIFKTLEQQEQERALAEQEALERYVAAIRDSARLYAQTLRLYFPDLDPPAEQNHSVTEEVVANYFIGRRQAGDITNLENADSVLLAQLFGKLKGEDGTTWNLPWDEIYAE